MASSSEFDAIETELGEDLKFPGRPQADSRLLDRVLIYLRQSRQAGWVTVFGEVAVITPTRSFFDKLVEEYDIPITTKLKEINPQE